LKKFSYKAPPATPHGGQKYKWLCCAVHFLTAHFINGAEQSALYIDKVELALATGAPMPSMAKSKLYQKIASSTGSVWTYAPEIYGAEAFNWVALTKVLRLMPSKPLTACRP